jgi:D-alanyl-D-alanine carboxypeptidase
MWEKMKKNRLSVLMLAFAMTAVLLLAGCAGQSESAEPAEPEAETETEAAAEEGSVIDYMVLVNQSNPLPEGWEEALETTAITNSVGDEVLVESKAYEAYLKLKEAVEKDLEGYEKGEVRLELDSAYRSVAAQQKIVDDFTEKYGEDYVKKYVAVPGYSEHHTGLALDLYFTIDGKDVYENEDLVQYPDIWDAVHARLPEFGFILRFPKDGEAVTGYAYEPWHIRYLDDPEIAKEITDKGLTLEEYLSE